MLLAKEGILESPPPADLSGGKPVFPTTDVTVFKTNYGFLRREVARSAQMPPPTNSDRVPGWHRSESDGINVSHRCAQISHCSRRIDGDQMRRRTEIHAIKRVAIKGDRTVGGCAEPAVCDARPVVGS